MGAQPYHNYAAAHQRPNLLFPLPGLGQFFFTDLLQLRKRINIIPDLTVYRNRYRNQEWIHLTESGGCLFLRQQIISRLQPVKANRSVIANKLYGSIGAHGIQEFYQFFRFRIRGKTYYVIQFY